MNEKDNVAQKIDRLMQPKWDECGIVEKVERLRQELYSIRWSLNAARRVASAFEEHEHNIKGEIVVPFHTKRGQDEAMGRDVLA